ncbi:hypothetical protein [Algoriphagus aquimarinus]|uniref:hypothetical protein n=1 Tax=Algoriphagus aquimarinus TaxID=237018 RepID=UPI0030D90E23|tara:strand:+ start:97 stop:1380 length:1284 start_codon:yes stop_codon:yes gene_type:complete
MTAVVGVLNKQAVAIAADSAVTIGNGTGTGTKIFNRANKIFTLSKYHPVGIMIYNEGSFMETPWETIIKVYRKEINRKSFDTVNEYKNDFLLFLTRNNFFILNNSDINFLKFSLEETLEELIKDLLNRNDFSKIDPKSLPEIIFKDLRTKISEYVLFFEKNRNELPEFLESKFEEYAPKLRDSLNSQISEKLSQISSSYDDSINEEILKLFFLFVTDVQSLEDRFTGLVFTGFGEKEYFPQLISLRVSFPFQNKLRFYVKEDENASIGSIHGATISPFAQKDVIETILMGIDPGFQNSIFKNFEDTSQQLVNLLANSIEKTDPITAKSLRTIDLDPVVKNFVKSIEEYQNSKHISPLMDAVSTLSKEDLAEMAESLIYLTYLKRRITFAQESVGGPVDVAIISKGDGFIWIKRKHYMIIRNHTSKDK